MNPIITTRIKFITLFIISNIILFTRENFYITGSVIIAAVIIIFLFNLVKPFYTWIKKLTPILIIICIIQTGTYYQNFGYSTEGLILGIYSATRIFSLFSIAFIVTHTTNPHLIAQSLQFLPFHLGFVLMISVALLSHLKEEAEYIRIAQYSRGYRAGWNVIKTYLPLFSPLFTRSITRAEKLSIAIQARGGTVL